jgi:ABC-type transport system involved in multi-copper enzyme maturation permease subunit
MLSLGLYLGNQIIVLFAVMGTAGAISGEIESGVIQAVLVKSLRRREYFLGKYLGFSLIFIIYSSLFFLAVIGLNLFFSQGALVIYGLSIIKALLYYLSIPLILLGLCLWGSTHLPTLVNGIITVMLYSFATVGGILELIGNMIQRQTLVNIGIISSLVLPVDALYRKMLSMLFTASPGDLTIFWDSFFLGNYEPSIWMLLYSLLYLLFFLWQGVRVFSKRDI